MFRDGRSIRLISWAELQFTIDVTVRDPTIDVISTGGIRSESVKCCNWALKCNECTYHFYQYIFWGSLVNAYDPQFLWKIFALRKKEIPQFGNDISLWPNWFLIFFFFLCVFWGGENKILIFFLEKNSTLPTSFIKKEN